jgi:predicted RNase H-like HicB family nuclease
VTTYAVVIERASDGGYGAWSPDLPGVVALGDSEAETLEEMRQAIEFHLDGLREDGQPIPHPSTVAATPEPSAPDRWHRWLTDVRFGGGPAVREYMPNKVLYPVRETVLDKAKLRPGETLFHAAQGTA